MGGRLGRRHADAEVWLNLLIFKFAALPLSILALFLVYWLLPNRKIDPRNAAAAAILTGIVLEALKYLNLLAGD